MPISFSKDVEETLRSRAAAAGFRTVEEYIVDLVASEDSPKPPMDDALRRLRELRQEIPRLRTDEIVDLVREGRDRCP